jgi:hypothetical protein
MSCAKLNSGKDESKNNGELTFNLIAHRGGIVDIPSLPENSLKALKEAINRSYKMVEIDIRSTLDGIPIIYHDSIIGDVNKGETRLMSSLTFEELQNIKERNNFLQPCTLEKFANTSNGEISFLLDFKGNYSSDFYKKCMDILKENNIPNVKIAWSKRAKEFFKQVNYGKIGLSYSDFEKATSKNTLLKEDYFLVISAFDYNEGLIKKANDIGVEVVVSVNLWKYGQRGITNTSVIKVDIDKMLDSGVQSFLIDSDLEFLFNIRANKL